MQQFKDISGYLYIHMTDINIRNKSVVVAEFNTTVRELITKLEKKSRSEIELANLDRLKKRISLLKQLQGENVLLIECTPFMLEYREQILSRNEIFFTTMDIRAAYLVKKKSVDKQDEFIFDLTDTIRTQYNKATQTEKNDVYARVKTLFNACIEYTLA